MHPKKKVRWMGERQGLAVNDRVDAVRDRCEVGTGVVLSRIEDLREKNT
jgi:hypothetical protein